MSYFLIHSLCIALIFVALAHAQTSTSCNPFEKSCPSDPGLSSSTYTHDFTQGADNTNWNVTHGTVSYTSSGAEFTINKQGDAPTLQSNWYMLFGRVSFLICAAPGTGIVSSAILQSDDLDEIDWEWVGGNAAQVQSNYFGKGNTSTYDRAVWSTTADTQASTRNYTIVWSVEATTWYVDDKAIRTLGAADAVDGKNYPQTPMNVRVGIWAGGDPSNDEGTIEWAGGLSDYSKGPYTMVLEKVEVVNQNPADSYTYSDMTGSAGSIKLENGHPGAQSGVSASKATSMATETAGVSKATGVASSVGSGTATSTVAAASLTATPEASVHRNQEGTAAVKDIFGLWKLGIMGLVTLTWSTLH